MLLSDIDDWNVAALNAISYELSGELKTVEQIVADLDVISRLPGWNSPAADAARGTIEAATANMLSDAAVIGAVEQLATETALAVQNLKDELSDVRADVSSYNGDLALADSGEVTVTDPDRVDELQSVADQLESRAKALIHLAEDIDADCSEVFGHITAGDITAAGATNSEQARQSGRAQSGLSAPLPPHGDDVTPYDQKAWWDALSDEEQQRVIGEHPDWVANNYGVPAYVRRQVNLDALDGDIAAAQAEVDAIPSRQEFRDEYPGLNGAALNALYTDLYAPKQEYLRRLLAIKEGMSVHNDPSLGYDPNKYLLMYKPATDGETKAAIAVGNPDTATHVSVTVPGMDTHATTLPGMVSEATALRSEALTELGLDPNHPGTVSTIAWLGYDPPDTTDASIFAAADQGRADAAAAELADFYRGINATNVHSSDVHLSAFGHSYGSLTTAQALHELGQYGVVDDAVFYGSPGLGYTDEWYVDPTVPEANPVRLPIYDESDLFLDEGHAFVMQAPADKVAGDPTFLGVEYPSLGDLGGHGPNPSDLPMVQLSTEATTTPDGVVREGVTEHAHYPRMGDANPDVLRTPGYNLAVVLAGLADQPNRLVR